MQYGKQPGLITVDGKIKNKKSGLLREAVEPH